MPKFRWGNSKGKKYKRTLKERFNHKPHGHNDCGICSKPKTLRRKILEALFWRDHEANSLDC